MLALEMSKQLQVPERNLLVAMLERAIFDYVGNHPGERSEAEKWLFGEDDMGRVEFSFPWVCCQLNLNHAEILQRIQGMQPRQYLKTQQWWGLQRSAYG